MGDAVEPARGDHNDVDDAARLLCIAPALRCRLHHEPGAVEVGVDDGVPALHREIDRGLWELSAGAVDQDVEPALPGPDLLEQRGHRLRIADVDGMAAGREAMRRDRRDERVDFFRAAAGNDHMRAKPCEQPGRRAADASCAARNQHDLTAERAHRIDGRLHGERGIVQPEALGGFGGALRHRAPCPSAIRPR